MSVHGIRAVIFDCDGVLADSEQMHEAATREELRDRGITVPVAAGCKVVVLDRDHRERRQFSAAAAVATSMAQVRKFLLGVAHTPRTDVAP